MVTPVTTHGMVVRHFNRVGVLAMVLDALKAWGVNVEEMQNSIFEGGTATCSLRLDQAPQPAIVAELTASRTSFRCRHTDAVQLARVGLHVA